MNVAFHDCCAPLTFTNDINGAHMAAAVRFEARLRPRYRLLAESEDGWFELFPGTQPVVLTAPHATAATRHGRLRGPDTGTGWLSYLLHRLTGAHLLVTTHASPSDPNFYDDNAFKARLTTLLEQVKPRIVLDLHGSHFSRPFDVDLGTMHGEALLGRTHLLDSLRAHLNAEGVKRLSDNFFPAARNATVTRWVAHHGVPCVQVEVQSTWINPARDRIRAHRAARLAQGLSRYIRSLNVSD